MAQNRACSLSKREIRRLKKVSDDWNREMEKSRIFFLRMHEIDLEVSEQYKRIGVTTGRPPGFERGGRFEHLYDAIGMKDCYAPVQKLEFVYAKKTDVLGTLIKAMRRLRADENKPLVHVDPEMFDLDMFRGLTSQDFRMEA